jgi:hypothetical protein
MISYDEFFTKPYLTEDQYCAFKRLQGLDREYAEGLVRQIAGHRADGFQIVADQVQGELDRFFEGSVPTIH